MKESGCDVNVKCKCVKGATGGGIYKRSGKNTSIEIYCAKTGVDYDITFVHEYVHALQNCINPNQECNCENAVKRELQAYCFSRQKIDGNVLNPNAFIMKEFYAGLAADSARQTTCGYGKKACKSKAKALMYAKLHVDKICKQALRKYP